MFEFSKSINPAAGTLSKTGVAALTGPDAAASRTSALMILPFGPVPWTPARLTPCSLAKFWAKGLAKTLPPDDFAGAPFDAAAGVDAAGVEATGSGVGSAAGVEAGAEDASATKSAKAGISSSSSTRIAKGVPNGMSFVFSGNKIFAM